MSRDEAQRSVRSEYEWAVPLRLRVEGRRAAAAGRGDYPPAGVPNTGFVPLIALLRRRLTDSELTTVVRWCCAAGPPILPADIGVAIERLLRESAADSDKLVPSASAGRTVAIQVWV